MAESSGLPVPVRTISASEPLGADELRALVDSVGDVIALVSEDGTLRYVSSSIVACAGYRPEEVIGLSLSDVLEAGERRGFAAEILSRPGQHGPRIVTARARDGSPIRLEVVVNNRLDDPDVHGFVVVAREVGSRLAAEEQLRRSEERARALLQRASDMVLVLDRGGWITWASPSVTPALGYQADDLIGRNASELVAPDDRVAATAMLAWEGLTPDHDELPVVVQLRHADGSLRTFALEPSNLLDNPAVAGIVVTGTDVTERLDVQAATARVERHFRALVQESSDIVLLLDTDGRIRFTSPSVERVLHLAPEAALGESLFDLVHPDDRPRAERAFAALCARPGPGEPVHLRFRSTGDGWRDLELLGNNLLGDPDVGAVVMNGRDVTERRRAEDLLAQEAKLLERIASSGPTDELLRDLAAVLETHLPGVACSIGVLERDGVIRHPSSPTLPESLTSLIDDVDPSSALGQSLRETDQLIVYADVLADERWEGVSGAFAEQDLRACWVLPLLSPDTGGLLGTVTSFTAERGGPTVEQRSLIERMGHLAAIGIERGRFQAELEHRALHDALTGLPNRALLIDRLEHALARVRRAGSAVALLFVDLDQFKVVNDSLGHDAGDRLLMEVATRFRRCVRAGDTVARLGGDEFAVLCEDVSSESDGVAVAGHLHAALAPPFRVSGGEIFVNCSIGIALASGGEPESVIRDADAAMYRAKDLGRNRHVVFEDALHDRMVRRLMLQRDVRAALAADEFTLLYQPRVRLSDGRITGVEALLRWKRSSDELIGADEVIPVAEETGLIVPLGGWVMDEACRQAAAWNLGGSGVAMSVNLSGRQLVDPALLDLVQSLLRRHSLPPDLLCLEVTESELAGDADACVGVVEALKQLGVRVAIDDFGTGYATLDYVRRFSMADELKIDRSFVAGLRDIDSPDAAIVSAAIVLANALGFETVAEGVETEAQLDVLRRLGCEHAQGYWFSPPVDAERLGVLLARGAIT